MRERSSGKDNESYRWSRRLHPFSLLLVLRGTSLGGSSSCSSPGDIYPFEAACGTHEHCLRAPGLSWGSCSDPTTLSEPHWSSQSEGLHVSPGGAQCLAELGRLPRARTISQHEAQQRFQRGNVVRQTIK